VTGTMAHLRPVHLAARADARTLLGAIERWKARRLYCIPPVWERVLDCTEAFDLSSLRETMTGTMRVDPALMQRVHDRFPGTKHRIVYGSTEAGIVLTLGDDALADHPDHAGLPALGVEVRIEDGELQTRSDFMMSGYFNLPEETAATLRDGWYCTGDLAERDADGYYRIVGRRREVIRTGGETVAPAEVEAAVCHYPGVCAAAVFGVPSSSWGEIVCAALTMEPGHELPSPQAMRAFLDARLVSFKHPRAIVAIDEIPRTAATGQIQRARVRDIISARPEFGRVLTDFIER
ncbi:MAG TPA: long-chain fatty acid--CoA ligase, partial [Paracoccus sp.]|nr:long-chain fatty acid--CoA ligase [Paracoccus sp. (in: a-proteobacteria)]